MTGRPPAARYSSSSPTTTATDHFEGSPFWYRQHFSRSSMKDRPCEATSRSKPTGRTRRLIRRPYELVAIWSEMRRSVGNDRRSRNPTPLSGTGHSDGMQKASEVEGRSIRPSGWIPEASSARLRRHRFGGFIPSSDVRWNPKQAKPRPATPVFAADFRGRARLALDDIRFGGFIPSRDVRGSPKEMRIPPLRSAVKTGSDVSPDSSVTPGSVRGVTNANPIGEHTLVFPPKPPEPRARDIPVDPAGGYCYRGPIQPC